MAGKDLVVIGAGVGGLSAAIHARLAGWNVLVLEQQAVAGGKAQGIETGGYHLDPGPSIIIMPEIYEAVFQAAGRDMSDYLRFMPLSTVSRVFFGDDLTVDIPASRQAAIDLLRGLAPRDADSLESLLDKLAGAEPLLHDTVYRQPFSRPWHLLNSKLLQFGRKFNAIKPYRQMVDEMFEHPLTRSFFYGFPSYGGQSYNSVVPGAFFIPYYMLCRGVYAVEGGVRAIPAALMRLAKEMGVEFRFDSPVTGVSSDGQKIRSVEAGGDRLSADAFVANMDRFSFARLLGEAVPNEPNLSYFTLHVGLRRRVENLEHHNLFVPKSFARGFEEIYADAAFPTEPIVYVNATRGQDPDAAPPGCENLFAVVTVPGDVATVDYRNRSSEYAGRVRQVLRNRGLDWDESEVDFERIQTPLTFAERDGSFGGSLYGLAEKHRLWGMFPATNEHPRFRNLKFCGGSVQPGAGLPMVTLSGKFAVDALPRP